MHQKYKVPKGHGNYVCGLQNLIANVTILYGKFCPSLI